LERIPNFEAIIDDMKNVPIGSHKIDEVPPENDSEAIMLEG